jgi:hypothetical protein
MKTKIMLLMLWLGFNQCVAQNLEMGVELGSMRYLGDLANNLSSPDWHLQGGFNVLYNLNKRFNLATQINFGHLSGYDVNSTDPSIKERNLNFESSVTEFALISEFKLIPYDPVDKKKRFTVFVFGGISAVYSIPKTQLNGQWVSLSFYRTEGQSLVSGVEDYSSFSLMFPVGFGFKIAPTQAFNVGFRFNYRFSTTDYLDDVSGKYADVNLLNNRFGADAAQLSNRTNELTGGPILNLVGQKRGNSDDKDVFFTLGVFVTYNFYPKYKFIEN